jgi:hypothetical protein
VRGEAEFVTADVAGARRRWGAGAAAARSRRRTATRATRLASVCLPVLRPRVGMGVVD